MKFHRLSKGFTLIELLVVISIIAVLASLAVPAVTGALVKGQIIQAVSNCRQIHLAAMSMATDAATNSDSTMGWPGDTKDGTTAIYSDGDAYVTGATGLIGAGYLKGEDLKIFAAPGIPAAVGTGTSGGTWKYATNSAFSIYKAQSSDPSTEVFLTTKNVDATAALPVIDVTKTPFKDKGYVICRFGGDVGKYTTAISGSGTYTTGTHGKF